MAIRLVSLVLVVALVAGPSVPGCSPAYAQWDWGYHNNAFFMAVRIVPAVAGAVTGWVLGAHFGTVGKVIGGAAGFMVGKWVGKLIARQLGDVAYDPYPFPGQASTTTGTGISINPTAPASSGQMLSVLREKWLSALDIYQDALKSGSAEAKARARTSYEKAQQEYERAKEAASR